MTETVTLVFPPSFAIQITSLKNLFLWEKYFFQYIYVAEKQEFCVCVGGGGGFASQVYENEVNREKKWVIREK